MRGIKTLIAVVSSAVLASCGGGGDNAGDFAAFSVIPSETTFTTDDADCTANDLFTSGSVQYIINGGTPPFRVVTDAPGTVRVSSTTLSGKDPVFTMRYSGSACEGTYLITVLDYHSRAISITINVDPEAPTTTTPTTP